MSKAKAIVYLSKKLKGSYYRKKRLVNQRKYFLWAHDGCNIARPDVFETITLSPYIKLRSTSRNHFYHVIDYHINI